MDDWFGPDTDRIATLIGNVGVITAAIAALACVIWYARVQWWRSQMGRHLMSLQAVIALTLSLGVVRIFFGDDDFWRYARLIVFLGVPVVLARQFWLIVKANRRS